MQKLLAIILLLISRPIHAETLYSEDDISNHASVDDCWVSYQEGVYDLTDYISQHDIYMDIREWCGQDMTYDFETKADLGRDHRYSSYSLLEVYRIGSIAANMEEPVSSQLPEEITEEHSDDEEYSVEVSGQELKTLTVEEVAKLWEISSQDLLDAIVYEFDLTGVYTANSLIDQLKQEGDFAPKQIKDIAEDLKNGVYEQEPPKVERTGKNPYSLLFPLFGTLLLYWSLYYAIKNKKLGSFNLHKFNMIFNTILLLTLIPSFGFGIFMMLRYQFPSLYEIQFNFIYWHVELSVVMGTIAVSHLLQRWAQYMSQLRSLKK